MPRNVDHRERRREIIEALWRVAERDGLGAVSFRDVAAEAGVSVRCVQYYFSTKAELLARALQLVGERVVERGLTEMDRLGPEPSPRRLLRAAIVAALPMDDERRTLAMLFFSLYVAAIADKSLRSADALQAPRWTADFAATLIRQARPDLDAETEAIVLMRSTFTPI